MGLLLTVACVDGADRTPVAAPNISRYTSLRDADCRLAEAEDENTGESLQRCPGVGDYQLLVSDSDGRMSISVVVPDGATHPLNFSEVISRHFSSLGEKAEWRMQSAAPEATAVALIVRVKALEDPDSSRETSYLAVARISPGKICVVGRVAPSETANEQARAIADGASTASCLPSLDEGVVNEVGRRSGPPEPVERPRFPACHLSP